jgi:GTP-binding protein YchF
VSGGTLRMGLTCGIIGLPGVGKSTVFSLLTGEDTNSYKRKDANLGTARVPDERLDFLVELYKPRKVVYAQMDFTDIPGLASSSGGKANPFLQHVRGSELLIQVVRAFEDETYPHIYESIDPLRDYDETKMELIFSDLDLVEKRIQRIESGKKKKENLEELQVLFKCKERLEEELPIAGLDLTSEEERLISGFDFLTARPMIVVINVDESQFRGQEYPGKREFEERLNADQMHYLVISAQIESEINALEEGDRMAFMEDLQIEESGISRLAKAAYARLGLISFFTVGEDEVKAWTITDGLDARRAAGKIHSDIERGFIRAEVTSFSHIAAEGLMSKCKEKGLTRLEGKDYIVKDGDIITFRFNV